MPWQISAKRLKGYYYYVEGARNLLNVASRESYISVKQSRNGTQMDQKTYTPVAALQQIIRFCRSQGDMPPFSLAFFFQLPFFLAVLTVLYSFHGC